MLDRALRRARDRNNDRGAVAVLFAIFLVVFMVLVAFVVDLGQVYARKAALQNTVDAAALAAARDLTGTTVCTGSPQVGSGDTPCQVAGNYVVSNGFTRPATTLLSESGSYKIAVQVSSVVPFTFGRFAGISSRTVTARAVAVNKAGGGSNFAIYAGDQITVNGGGNAGMNVTGGVFAGGTGGSCSSHCALEFNGQASKLIISDGAYAPTAGDIKGDYRKTAGGSNISTATPSTVSTNPVQFATDSGLVATIDALPQSPSPAYVELVVDDGECSIDLGNSSFTGKEVLYCDGNLKVTGSAKSSLKMLRAKNDIELDVATLGSSTQAIIVSSINGTVVPDRDAVLYGTIYAPNGEVRTNGHAFMIRTGRVIAADFRVNGNGDTFTVDTTGDPYAPKGVALIE